MESVKVERRKANIQRLAEAYGMGDVLVGLRVTGQYPNPPAEEKRK